MITESMIYWITRLDGIYGASLAFMVVSGVVIIFTSIFAVPVWADDDDDLKPVIIRLFKIFVPMLIFFTCAAILVPTTKEAVAIYALPAISRNDDMQEIPANTAKLINEKLKEWIDDTTGLNKDSSE